MIFILLLSILLDLYTELIHAVASCQSGNTASKAVVLFKFQHPSQSRQQAFYSSNKLPHVKRQKGRALLVRISTQKFSRQIWAPLYKPLNEGEDDAKIHPNIFRNERRKSCYSWRLRQKETGSRNMNDRASTDSQVFEMIHLDENNEEVSSKDKIVTGSESNLFFTDTLKGFAQKRR